MMQQIRAAEGKVIQFRGRQQVGARFTPRDLLDFELWCSDDHRVEVDRTDCDGIGQFAMVYEGAKPWASWAITRDNGQVLVWECVSLSDVGRFDCMQRALAALAGGDADPAPVLPAQIISFREALARRMAS